MSVPDSSLIYCVPIQTYFVDKDSGAPLAAGVVTFYEANTSNPKNIYQQSNTPPYTFTVLNNPITLSGVGTFQDGSGNDINVYLYPYVGSPSDIIQGALQLYDITVYSADGVLQETRSAWPPNVQASFGSNSLTNSENQITNSQFVDVFFQSPQTFSVSGTDKSTAIAPGWYVLTTGTGTFTVSQVAVASGTSTNLTGAPYELTISSSGLTTLSIYYLFESSPLLLAGNYVSGFAEIASTGGSQLVSLIYQDSDGNQTILAGPTNTNPNNSFTTIRGTAPVTIQNTASAPAGFVQFVIKLVANITFKITSTQMVSVTSSTALPGYLQQSVDLQTSGLYWHDKPQLEFKPIPSYLVGWDFPLNPAQFLGKTVGASASQSYYVWDQTIVYQSTVNRVLTSQETNGAIKLTATGGTVQLALIQYLDGFQVQKILTNNLSVNLNCLSAQAVTGSVSLWYTNNASLPNITSGVSVVTTLDAFGYPSAVASGWTEITNLYGTQRFTGTSTFTNIGFNGWQALSTATAAAAKYFAIVVGTGSIGAGNGISFQSISLVPGDIPTIPAPKTFDETLRECQYYYQKSFISSEVPRNNAGLTSGPTYYTQARDKPDINYIPVRFAVPMRTIPVSPPIFYNPTSGATGQILNVSTGASYTLTGLSTAGTANTLSLNGFVIQGTPDGTSTSANVLAINWAADARLGVI